MLTRWLICFLITCLSESLFALYLCRDEPVFKTKLILAVVLGSCVTHPLLWFVLPHYIQDYWSMVILGETAVVAVEAFVIYLVLFPLFFKRESTAIKYALLYNMGSYVLGLVLRATGVL